MLDFLKTAIFITKILMIKFICNLKPISAVFRGHQSFRYLRKHTVISILDGR